VADVSRPERVSVPQTTDEVIDVIQKNWEELIKPNKLEINSGHDAQRFATVVAEPLERGFGLTLGNALRRVLMSSLQGAAVTAVQIDGVLHEFSSIAGVREDVTDIILNIKNLALRLHAEGPKRMSLSKKGPGVVTAGDITAGADIEVLNPELVICTLDEGAEMRMEFTVALGKGYVASDRNRPEDAPIGLIPIDSLYSPVKRVSYKVENTREGQVLDYDKLTLQIETNGAVTPEDAVAYDRAHPAGSAPDLRELRRARAEACRGKPSGTRVQCGASQEGRRAGAFRPFRPTASRTTTSSISATSSRRRRAKCSALRTSAASR